jgi:glutathione S-transferase
VLLWDSPVSANCYKVRLLLDHLGIAYERLDDGRRRPLGPPGGARRVQPLDPAINA